MSLDAPACTAVAATCPADAWCVPLAELHACKHKLQRAELCIVPKYCNYVVQSLQTLWRLERRIISVKGDYIPSTLPLSAHLEILNPSAAEGSNVAHIALTEEQWQSLCHVFADSA
jgi:hypothetical protein